MSVYQEMRKSGNVKTYEAMLNGSAKAVVPMFKKNKLIPKDSAQMNTIWFGLNQQAIAKSTLSKQQILEYTDSPSAVAIYAQAQMSLEQGAKLANFNV